MASKRPSPPDVSEEEEENSSSEEEEEEESPKPTSSSPPKKTETTNAISQPESSSSSSSGSDSEPDPTVKPLASKPMDSPPKTTKPRSKRLSTRSESVAKRPNENASDVKNSKRAKKKAPETELDNAVAEDDDLAILKGMIEYSAKKGADPALNLSAFLEFVKKSLSVDVSRAQLIDKIKVLKKKYENNVGKGKSAKAPKFSKPYEKKVFELSKEIWAVKGSSEKIEAKSNGNARRSQKVGSMTLAELKAELLSPSDGSMKSDKVENDHSLGPSLCLEELIRLGLGKGFVKEGLGLIGESMKEDWEEKWKELRMAELELFMKRAGLFQQQAKMILEAYKSAGR